MWNQDTNSSKMTSKVQSRFEKAKEMSQLKNKWENDYTECKISLYHYPMLQKLMEH